MRRCAREFADTTKRRQKRIFERRGTADLIAKSLNNYPVNTPNACKRRARRAHAQASGTHQTTKLSNGKLDVEVLVLEHVDHWSTVALSTHHRPHLVALGCSIVPFLVMSTAVCPCPHNCFIRSVLWREVRAVQLLALGIPRRGAELHQERRLGAAVVTRRRPRHSSSAPV